MRIWYINKYVSLPNEGNVGLRPYYLMSALNHYNCKTVIFTSKNNPYTSNASKVSHNVSNLFRINFINTARYKKPNSFIRIISWIQFELSLIFMPKIAESPNIIIASSPSIFSIFSGLFLKKIYKAKLFFEVRDIWPLTLVAEGGFSKTNPFILILSCIEKIAYRYSDLIIGTMPNLKEHVLNVCKDETIASKVICVPFGIPELENKNTTKFITHQTNSDSFLVGYVGTVGKTNALDTLFHAFDKIHHAQKKNIQCHVVGDGPLLKNYQKKYAYNSNIIFHGAINRNEVISVMQSFDLMYLAAFNSEIWKYGQSLNKLVDYMLAGRPILASYSGYTSMIDEAGCGWFIEAENPSLLYNKLLEISDFDKRDLDQMGMRGHDWIIKNRNYKSIAETFIKEIKSRFPECN